MSKQQLMKQVGEKNNSIEGLQKTVQDKSARIESEEARYLNLTEEKTEVAQKKKELEREKEDIEKSYTKLQKMHEHKLRELDETELAKNQGIDKIRFLEKDLIKYDRDLKNMSAKNNGLDVAKEAALQEKMSSVNAVSALTREIEWVNKQTDKEQQNIHNLIRERDMMKKGLAKVEDCN